MVEFITKSRGALVTSSQREYRFLKSKLRPSFNRVVSFFFGSLFGLSVDLCVFQAAIFVGISALYSNMISSGMAIVSVYFLVSRCTFNKSLNIKRFLLFFLYYTLSVAAFSLFIEYGAAVTGWPALLCKIFTLPASFTINFILSNIILGKK